MEQAGLKIIVSADVQQVAAGMQDTVQTIQDLEKELNLLGRAIDQSIAKGQDISKLEDAFDSLNNKIKTLKATAGQNIPSAAISGIGRDLVSVEQPIEQVTAKMGGLGLNTTQARIAFIDLGRIVTGQGFSLRSLASNFSLLGPGVTIAAAAIYGLYEVLNKQTDAEKRAEEQAKKLHETLVNLKSAADVTSESTGSEAGNIARVQLLAAAIRDTNKTYAERKNALDQLRETNKAYFGDLTLEARSLKILADRVNDYSNALIAQAVIKGQSDAIAGLTSKLLDQERALTRLKTAKQQADAEAAKPQASSSGNVAGGGVDILNNDAQRNAVTATSAFEAQREVVFKLRQQIAEYHGDLTSAIEEQLKYKPLKTAPEGKDDLKSIIPILEQIKRIYDDLGKSNKEPLFKLKAESSPDSSVVQVIQAQIAEAIKKAATADSPELADAYRKLSTALNAKLSATLNPNLSAHIKFDLIDPAKDQFAGIESKVEKEFGGKGLDLKIPIHLAQDIDGTGFFLKDDVKKIEEELKNDPGLAHFFVNATADVRLNLGKALIKQSDLDKMKEVITKNISNAAVAGFKDVGVVIGDLLSGQKNPLSKAIQDFTSVLGDGLIKIGESMIAASALMQALKASLGALFENPAGGLVQGIATVALGEVVKNVGAHAFATGGIITGPTLGLVGEAGPEVIFPLDRLNQFVKSTAGNGRQNINVTGVIRGRDLAIVQARDSKLQNLTS